jgi:iron complex outermembrane receptor protein
MNYGTSLGKEKFHQCNCKFSIKRKTGRAKDATGNLFNAFNAIEQRAEAGTNINSLFGNINNPNTQILGLIKTYTS